MSESAQKCENTFAFIKQNYTQKLFFSLSKVLN